MLGGSSEASALARLLARRADIAAILSFAGRTKDLIVPPIPFRVGGFGGAEGLAAYLRHEAMDVLVDATHPFAETISANAAKAAASAGVPLLVLTRPPWMREASDRWIDVATMEAAVAALGSAPRRVFLTIGRSQLEAFAAAPQHFYLIRSVDPVDPALCLPYRRLVLARGPFDADAEEALMRAEKIDCVVSKNSGGAASYGKLEAARRLGLPVIMVGRPQAPHGAALYAPEDVVARIEAHGQVLGKPLALRGV